MAREFASRLSPERLFRLHFRFLSSLTAFPIYILCRHLPLSFTPAISRPLNLLLSLSLPFYLLIRPPHHHLCFRIVLFLLLTSLLLAEQTFRHSFHLRSCIERLVQHTLSSEFNNHKLVLLFITSAQSSSILPSARVSYPAPSLLVPVSKMPDPLAHPAAQRRSGVEHLRLLQQKQARKALKRRSSDHPQPLAFSSSTPTSFLLIDPSPHLDSLMSDLSQLRTDSEARSEEEEQLIPRGRARKAYRERGFPTQLRKVHGTRNRVRMVETVQMEGSREEKAADDDVNAAGEAPPSHLTRSRGKRSLKKEAQFPPFLLDRTAPSSLYMRGLRCPQDKLHTLPSPLPADVGVLGVPDLYLSSLCMPLLDHVFSTPSSQFSFRTSGTFVVALPPSTVHSSDLYLQYIPRLLKEGVTTDTCPPLNCNDGVRHRDKWMQYYRTKGRPKDAPMHWTLWATAAGYAWSTLLIQPWFCRSQTTYEQALKADRDISRAMKGFEANVVDIINRLMMIMHCDGQIIDRRAEGGGRIIHFMLYFEHLHLFPDEKAMTWQGQEVSPNHFSSWTHFCNPIFHFYSSSSSPCECRSILLPFLPGITVPMVYVSAGYSVFPWHKEDVSLKSSFMILSGAPKILFTVPSTHEAAFSAYLSTLLPSHCHPLFHRNKAFIQLPSAEILQRFDVKIRVCRVGEVVVIDSNVWHCGINMGENSSISVNIVGAGGVEELRKDLSGIVEDLQEMWRTLEAFWKRSQDGEKGYQIWRKQWLAAWKLFSGQVLIYNSIRQTNKYGVFNPLSDPSILSPLELPAESRLADAFAHPLPLGVPSVEVLSEVIREKGVRVGPHNCPLNRGMLGVERRERRETEALY